MALAHRHHGHREGIHRRRRGLSRIFIAFLINGRSVRSIDTTENTSSDRHLHLLLEHVLCALYHEEISFTLLSFIIINMVIYA